MIAPLVPDVIMTALCEGKLVVVVGATYEQGEEYMQRILENLPDDLAGSAKINHREVRLTFRNGGRAQLLFAAGAGINQAIAYVWATPGVDEAVAREKYRITPDAQWIAT